MPNFPSSDLVKKHPIPALENPETNHKKKKWGDCYTRLLNLQAG